MILANARILTSAEEIDVGWLRVHDGRIAELGRGAAPSPPSGVVDLRGDGRPA